MADLITMGGMQIIISTNDTHQTDTHTKLFFFGLSVWVLLHHPIHHTKPEDTIQPHLANKREDA